MQLSRVKPDDIVKCDVRGRTFLAFAGSKDNRVLKVNPITPGITYRTVKAQEVKGLWRRTAGTST